MKAAELRALQAPLKELYRQDPSTAMITLRSRGTLDIDRLVCRIEADRPKEAGLHPAAGGDGRFACSGELLLDSLLSCAGVTLCAVATAMDLPVRGGTVMAEADHDFRGTLGVSKEAPVGLTSIRLHFDLDTDATPEQLEKLLQLTERYCVVFQTLRNPPAVSITHQA